MTIRTEDDAKFLTIPKGRRNVGSTSSADTLIGEGLVSQLCSVHGGRGGGEGALFAVDLSISLFDVNKRKKFFFTKYAEVSDVLSAAFKVETRKMQVSISV